VENIGTGRRYYIADGVFDMVQTHPIGFDPSKHTAGSGMLHARQFSRTEKVTRTELQGVLKATRNRVCTATFTKKCDLERNIKGMAALAQDREADEDDIRSFPIPKGRRVRQAAIADGLEALAAVIRGATPARVKELLTILGTGEHRELEGVFTGVQADTGRFKMADLRVLDETRDWTKCGRQVDPRTLKEVVYDDVRYVLE
jgi:hypothetical protein